MRRAAAAEQGRWTRDLSDSPHFLMIRPLFSSRLGGGGGCRGPQADSLQKPRLSDWGAERRICTAGAPFGLEMVSMAEHRQVVLYPADERPMSFCLLYRPVGQKNERSACFETCYSGCGEFLVSFLGLVPPMSWAPLHLPSTKKAMHSHATTHQRMAQNLYITYIYIYKVMLCYVYMYIYSLFIFCRPSFLLILSVRIASFLL